MNTFANVPAFPTADMKVVVRPNFDTLYSSAWLDLTKEPMIVSVPDTHGRYYLLPMLDMWTDVFASPGWRTTGTQAGDYAVVPPGWSGSLPAGVVRIDAPTPYVWIIGRTKTDGPADYDAVHKIQAGLQDHAAVALGQGRRAGGRHRRSRRRHEDAAEDRRSRRCRPASSSPTPPRSSSCSRPTSPISRSWPRCSGSGSSGARASTSTRLDPAIKAGLETAPEDALKLMAWKVPSLARVVDGWSMNTDTMGVYGNYYLKRAIVTQLGLGANLPEDAIYPLNLADETGKPLDGANAYVLHFDKGATPPVNAFWSVTLYDSEGYQVANSLNRFAVSSWMPFKYDPDGSLDLYFQNASPGADKEANWLPAPKGPFNLTMRLYAPKSDALTGKWSPPPVMKQVPPTLMTVQ